MNLLRDNNQGLLAHKKQTISISKNEMKDLLRRCGRQIWEKLKEKARPEYQGNIWQNRDYRVDAGSALRDWPRVKSWNLQVNREAAREVLRGRTTHQTLFWDGFDLDNVPKYGVWEKSILDRFM
ncbi:7a47fd01-4468-4c98-bf17-48892ece3bfa [Thermothielavioides terrestris]|uniref:7a47fd01-4468-4c98-bf17-48892ece3bfa n=1 Tax=Thermothielavioides terrestris TaxID=2587410 RepID=A0A3S4AVA8_9PEZI|nr:7a47fd01-4468-4c98-bf17-48892ece3bfa [Thermothielavioides terrestris]